MEKLNTDDMLTGLSGSLGDGAVERIRADRCREDRTWRLLDAIKGRHKFDDFCRALAGLNPDLFKLVTGRDPTKEEIGRAPMVYLPDPLKPYHMVFLTLCVISSLFVYLSQHSHSRFLSSNFTGNHLHSFQVNSPMCIAFSHYIGSIIENAFSAQYLEFVLGNYPKELKKTIKSKGHATDKDYDHKIDFASGYIQLSATENVDFKELTSHHAQAAQAELQEKYKQIKKDIAMKELIETVPEGRSIRRVVVKGRGGVGKTTTSQWFCSEWADGNWGSKFSMVFSVRARVVMNSKKNLSLLELLKQCTSYATPVINRLTPACLKTWLKYHCERVLIIIGELDGVYVGLIIMFMARSWIA